MINNPPGNRVNIPEVGDRNRTAREIIAALSHTSPQLLGINEALDDTITLIVVYRRMIDELITTRHHRANLAAAALATLTAHHENEDRPLYYLCDELRAQGYLPPGKRGGA